MKKIITVLLPFLPLLGISQTILYQQDFESYPVSGLAISSMYGGGKTPIPDGAPTTCELSRGTAADFTSANVDFLASQNSSHFIAVNPDLSTCDGYFTAFVISDTMNFSGVSSLYFQGRYFHSSKPGWGGQLSIEIYTPSADTTISFPVNNIWENFNYRLSSKFIDDTVLVTMNFVAGDGIGLDDILFTDTPPVITSIRTSTNTENQANIFPTVATDHVTVQNPAGGSMTVYIQNTTGTVLKTVTISGNESNLDVSGLPKGMLFIRTVSGGQQNTFRFIKE